MNTEIPERPVLNMSIWYGWSGPLPNRAQFVCAYEMGFGVDDLPEAVFLVQGETDELWIIRDPPAGLSEMLAGGGDGALASRLLASRLMAGHRILLIEDDPALPACSRSISARQDFIWSAPKPARAVSRVMRARGGRHRARSDAAGHGWARNLPKDPGYNGGNQPAVADAAPAVANTVVRINRGIDWWRANTMARTLPPRRAR
jgi:hypothetical protein